MLLVTTSHSVLALTAPGSAPRHLQQGAGLYFGMARMDDTLVVAARRRLVSSPLPQWDERGGLLALDPISGRVRTTYEAPFALRDLHGIGHSDGALWATCAFDDLIAIRFPDGEWRRWWPLGEQTEPDAFHCNTLLFEPERVWVLAHRRGPSRLLAFARASALAGETTPPLECIELGVQAHNLWRAPSGALCTASSAEGLLRGSDGWRLEVGGFTRGIAALPSGWHGPHGEPLAWAVGVSELAERRQRDLTTGQVHFYTAEWQLAQTLALPGEGLVLELLWWG